MLQDQFVNRLLFIVVFGVVYIYAMMKMASYKSVETTPQKHIVLKIIGSINLIVGITCLIMGMFWLLQVQYPERTIDFSYSVNQIVRTSDKYVVWGYPTSEQNHAIMSITNVFSSIALATYCFLYKKSDRKWWKKILRFFYGLFMYAFYCSATNFHYFDVTEMVAPGLFCLMAGHTLVKAKKWNEQKTQLANQQRIAAIHKMMDERLNSNTSEEDESRFMPQNTIEETYALDERSTMSEKDEAYATNESGSVLAAEEGLSEINATITNKEIHKYCRHCGKLIDYDSSVFCKYCGKEL